MSHARVAVLTAMVQEMRPVVRELSLGRSAPLSGRITYRGAHHGSEVTAVVTGIGTAAARTATAAVLGGAPIDRVLVVGVAGAIDPTLRIGSVVTPEVVIDGVTGVQFRPDHDRSRVPAGALWTTDELLDEAARIEKLRLRGVVAVDMETAAIAEVCTDFGVPWSVFRAISDRAGDPRTDSSVTQMVRADGSTNLPTALRHVGRHPGTIVHLMRLGRGTMLATRSAARDAVQSLT